MKRAIWIISALLTIILSMVYFYFQGSFKINTKNDVFSFLSDKNAFVVTLKYESDLGDIFKKDENIPSLFYQDFIQEVINWNDLIVNNEELLNAFKNQDVYIASQKLNAKSAGNLYLIGLKEFSVEDPSTLFNNNEELVVSSKFREYEGERIYNFIGGNTNFYYALVKEVLLVSEHQSLIEDALKVKRNNAGLSSKPSFVKWQEEQIKSKSLMCLYVNHKALDEYYSLFFKLPFQKSLNISKDFADYSFLQLNYKSDAWILNGELDATERNYFGLLKTQTENRSYLSDYISINTWAFQNLVLSDAQMFRAELVKQNLLNSEFYYDAEFKLIQKKYFLDLTSIMNNHIGNEFIASYYTNYSLLNHTGYVGMMVLQQSQEFIQKIDRAQKNQRTEEYKTFSIKTFPIRKFMYLCAGEPFKELENNFYTVIEDRLLLSSSISDLKKYIDDYQSEQFLKSNEVYQNYLSSLNDQYNYLFYCGINGYEMGIKELLNDKSLLKLNDRYAWTNYQAFSYQVTSSDAGLISSIYLPLKKMDAAAELQEKWQIALESSISKSPSWIKLIGKDEYTVFAQDDTGNVYLIDEDSNIKWKRNIPGSILSEIKVVDYYKNGETQILFNTAKEIYLMDLKGNNMPNYPIRLSAPTNKGLSLFDYDGDKNYRIFISCENQCAYAYDISGRPLDGWNAKRVGNVLDKIQHIRVKGKDLIFIANKQGYFYFFNRKAELQAQYKDSANIVYSNPFYFDENSDLIKNRFVSTDQRGKIKSIFIDGHRLYKSVGTWTDKHYFLFSDVTGDEKKDCIFIDNNQLMVYKDDTTLAFNYQFNSSITSPPIEISLGTEEKYLAVFSEETQQAFLFNRVGALLKGFPIRASSIPSFKMSGNVKKMLVGTKEGKISCFIF